MPPINLRAIFGVWVFLAVWGPVPPACAQFPYALPAEVRFDTPVDAAKALEAADGLQARIGLLRPVAAAYLRAHAYENLPPMISGLSVPGNAAWQRTFLLANLDLTLGNPEGAASLLGQLPYDSLRDPVVLKFRIEHPGLFGDEPLQPPPGIDSGTPAESAKSYLDTLEPDKAWQIIAAHIDNFLDDLGVLHQLTAQIADQNLSPRLLPLLEERAKRQPESWDLRLTLAQFQVLTGDTAEATKSLRQVYAWKPDGSPPLEPAQRVAAMKGDGGHGVPPLDGLSLFSRVKTLENARDVALISLANLADRRGEGAQFVTSLEEEYRNDPIGRTTALMLINSRGLVLRELRDCLAKGPPPGLDALAIPWLQETRSSSGGVYWAQQERSQLADIFRRLRPAVSQGAPASAIPTGGHSNWEQELAGIADATKSDDPAVKEKFLAGLTASDDSPVHWLLSAFLHQAGEQPNDDFSVRGAAILLAKAAADMDRAIALYALGNGGSWSPPTRIIPGMGGNGMDRLRGSWGPRPPAELVSVNEQVEAAFIAQSAQPRALSNWRTAQLAGAPPSPALAAALEKLAGDASSQFRGSARIAEALLFHDVAGQEDHAIELLRQTIGESPSYAARLLLTAFLARRQQYKEAVEVFDGIKPVPGYFEAFLQGGRALLLRAEKGEPLFENHHPAPPRLATMRPATTTADLVADLQRLIDAKPTDPEASQQALAIANKLSAVRPAELPFPGRTTVLRAFAKFGGLEQQITTIKERIHKFPGSADAQLALGDACALSTLPETRSASTAAYRAAFQLAPDRADIAQKIMGPGFSIQEQEAARGVIDRQRPTFGTDTYHDIVLLFKEPEKLAHYSAAEVASILDPMLLPSEHLDGLDIDDGPPMSLLYPETYDFIKKIMTPERFAMFESHARRSMAEHPGDTRAPFVLLTLLVMDRASTLRAELPVCLEALRSREDDQLAWDLSALAQRASTVPETKSVAFDLFAEVRRRQAGKPSELAAIEQLASTALDVGDRERAEGALRELLEVAKTQGKPLPLGEWNARLGLMARSGMELESAELLALVYGKAERDSESKATSSFLLDYIESCLRYRQPEMGRKAVAYFQPLLTKDLENVDELGQPYYRSDQELLERIVESFVSLDCANEAAKALRTLQESRVAAAAPELRKWIESAQELLAQGTGGPGSLPVAFVESTREREMSLWWNESGLQSPINYGSRSSVSVFGADLEALKGRYSLEILGGDTPNHLTRLAVIPHATSRGEWHGTPDTPPASIHFTRVILTGSDGSTLIGPSVPVSPGEELLDDPEMTEALKAGTNSTHWTLPEGVLFATTGPVPSHQALSFFYQGNQYSCEIRGRRIPVHPGESFVLSAWLRDREGCRWGVRCLDSQGKELGDHAGTEVSAPSESHGWTLVEQRLESTPEQPGNTRSRTQDQLAPGTAFIEPVLKLSSNIMPWDARAPVRWAGLSLRSIAPAEPKPQTPARPPDQLGPEQTPAPSLAADKASTARNETLFAEFASAASRIAVSPEGDMIVAGCEDGTLHFLEYPSGKEMGAVHAHNDPVVALAVLPAKAGVYSVDTSGDTHLVSINPVTDDLVACTAHRGSVAVLSPARKWVIYASDESLDTPSHNKIWIEVVDLTTGKQVRVIEQPGMLYDLSLSPDQKQISVWAPGMDTDLVHSWELPSFNKLPDRKDKMGQNTVNGVLTRPLFVADPTRNRYVMVENSGRFVVRTMDNDILWTFSPALGATSLAVTPKDGVIFVCKADGKIWRCVSPK